MNDEPCKKFISSFSPSVDKCHIPLVHSVDPQQHKSILTQMQSYGLLGGSSVVRWNETLDSFGLQRQLYLESWMYYETDFRPLRKWLHECGIRFATEVVVYQSSLDLIATSWKFIVRYLPQYDLNCDLLITDRTCQWALAYSEGECYTFYCHFTRPKAGRMNWDYVLRVHEGLKIYPEQE